jgi:hypothetical protein
MSSGFSSVSTCLFQNVFLSSTDPIECNSVSVLQIVALQSTVLYDISSTKNAMLRYLYEKVLFSTYLLTYLLMELSASGEAANSAATQECPSILWNLKVHHHLHKSPPLVPILSQIDPIPTIPSYLSKICKIYLCLYMSYFLLRININFFL